jgi:hypothetical protein
MSTQSGLSPAISKVDSRGKLRATMQEHNNDLRISIHHLENFAAKVVSDPSLEAAREYLEDLQGAIACQRASLRSLNAQWRDFENS